MHHHRCRAPDHSYRARGCGYSHCVRRASVNLPLPTCKLLKAHSSIPWPKRSSPSASSSSSYSSPSLRVSLSSSRTPRSSSSSSGRSLNAIGGLDGGRLEGGGLLRPLSAPGVEAARAAGVLASMGVRAPSTSLRLDPPPSGPGETERLRLRDWSPGLVLCDGDDDCGGRGISFPLPNHPWTCPTPSKLTHHSAASLLCFCRSTVGVALGRSKKDHETLFSSRPRSRHVLYACVHFDASLLYSRGARLFHGPA